MLDRIAVMLASLLVVAAAHGQASFPDVPERHWAGEAVERLARLGILVGFPDGTFRGGESITRYEAALVIERLLTAVRDASDAADAALENQVATLRAAVMALAGEAEELQRREGANRQAIDALWAEVAALREELGMSAPAPLPPYPPAPEETDAQAPAHPTDDAAAPDAAPVEVPAPGDGEATESGDARPAQEPEDASPIGDATDPRDSERSAGDAPADDTPADGSSPAESPGAGADTDVAPDGASPVAGDADEAIEPLAVVRRPPSVYASVAAGAAVPRRWLARATVGVENLVTDRFGARVSLDLGRRSATPLASATLLGHATYRVADPVPLGGYVGAGMGVHLGGDGALASILGGATWSALDPVVLFAETTLDVYLAPVLAAGGSRFAPTLVVGARWTF